MRQVRFSRTRCATTGSGHLCKSVGQCRISVRMPGTQPTQSIYFSSVRAEIGASPSESITALRPTWRHAAFSVLRSIYGTVLGHCFHLRVLAARSSACGNRHPIKISVATHDAEPWHCSCDGVPRRSGVGDRVRSTCVQKSIAWQGITNALASCACLRLRTDLLLVQPHPDANSGLKSTENQRDTSCFILQHPESAPSSTLPPAVDTVSQPCHWTGNARRRYTHTEHTSDVRCRASFAAGMNNRQDGVK